MGVLPESTFPGVIFLVAALLVVGIFGLSLVNAAFSKLANRARKGKGKWSD
jgi:thiol:disulfide interchange protein